MTLLSELPRDLEKRLDVEAARRHMTTPELVQQVIDTFAAEAPGQTALVALPFYVGTLSSEIEEVLWDWTERQEASRRASTRFDNVQLQAA